MRTIALCAVFCAFLGAAPIVVGADANVPENPLRDVYFGNLHVHTR